MKIVFPILLTVIYTVALLSIGNVINKFGFNFADNTLINFQVNYQILLLFVAGISLVTTFLLNKENFAAYFSFGIIDASVEELKIFGINKKDNWLKTGLSLSIIITSITAIFMFFQLKQYNIDWSFLIEGLFWILLFSLTNSFSEEMIFRIGIVAPLKDLFQPKIIFLLSAIIFGLAHMNGMPNGIIGICLAGVLGFVLAKSVYETQGFFWAWIIHFFQDVVIFASLYLMSKSVLS